MVVARFWLITMVALFVFLNINWKVLVAFWTHVVEIRVAVHRKTLCTLFWLAKTLLCFFLSHNVKTNNYYITHWVLSLNYSLENGSYQDKKCIWWCYCLIVMGWWYDLRIGSHKIKQILFFLFDRCLLNWFGDCWYTLLLNFGRLLCLLHRGRGRRHLFFLLFDLDSLNTHTSTLV